jgi:hypothetical protein
MYDYQSILLWSTQLGGQRSWVVNAAEWSTQLDGLTAFSAGLNGDGFFKWVEWGRLFQLGWLGTAFSAELNGDGFFSWVE